MVRTGRPALAFVAWGIPPGRPSDIAGQLGGEARCLNHPRSWPVSIRYLLYTAETLTYLLVRRPRALIVTNPPILLGLLAVGYARVTGATMLLDSHPGGFGAQGDRRSARVQSLHRWVARRATSVLVTTDEWASVVRSWGGVADVTHEAPPAWSVLPVGRLKSPPTVLCVCVFAPDEPVDELLRAAALLPDVRFDITGDTARCPANLLRGAPRNVTFTGFLRGEDYARAIGRSSMVVALTTEPTSVMRAACEAVYAERPLIISDWPALRQAFPHAWAVDNVATSIAAGLRHVLDHYDEFCAAGPTARALQHATWARQLHSLRRRIATSTTSLGVIPSTGR